MPVGAYPGPNSHVGNGVTTVFAYSYRIIDKSDLVVTVNGVLQTLTTHYTVAGEGAANGGSITFVAAPANLAAIIIQRLRPYVRVPDYQRNGEFSENSVDGDFDSLEMQIQQIAAGIARAFKPPVEVTTDQVLTAAQWAARAGKMIGFDGAGNLGVFAALNPANPASAFVLALLDDPTAAAFMQTLGGPNAGAKVINGKIVRSVAGNAVTFDLKTLAGVDPTAADPVLFTVPTVTGGVQDGGYAIRSVVAALSVTVSSGSTLGHQSAVASAVYCYALDNAGTIELAVSSKCFGGASVQSSTAEGGAGGADVASTLYAGSARANVACVCLQRWKSTQAAAGTWAATTGEVQLFPFPFKKPKVTAIGATAGFTKDWDTLWLELYAKGAGGSGGGSSSASAHGGGGGEGEECWLILDNADFNPSLTVTIGAGGAAIAANTNSSGNNGGTTSIGTLLNAVGGSGATAGNSGGNGGLGGTGGANADLALRGAHGHKGSDTAATVAIAAAGGGKGGGDPSSSGSTNSGGGGGSGSTASASGAGGSGIVIITEHYSEGA